MYHKFFKRLFDLLLSIVAMPFLLIITLFVGIAIKCEDGGPVFYCGKRIGRNGKIFRMVKFRSMKVNAPDIRLKDGSTYNGDDDPRVTKVGKFLRVTSIDELPQFFNIFVGQMSLIGPRPDPEDSLETYTEEEKVFLKVRPGITGYNQAYFRNNTDSKQKIQNDVYYAQHCSFAFDVKIFFKTIAVVFKRENVYRDVENEEEAMLEVQKLKDQQSGVTATETDNQSNKQKLLIIGASILQVPAILKAKEMGLEVAVADYNPSAVGVALADKYFNASTIDKEAVLAVAREYRPDGIMTMATDMPMRTIAYVCGQMGLRAISEQCAVDCTDKTAMIRRFKQGGVPSPQFWEVKDQTDLDAIREELVFPCIMKPADNSGSRGVVLCHNFEELKSGYEYSVASSRGGEVLVEEYMTGDEVSVETFVVDGKAHVLQITDKLTTGAPHFVEMGHSQPTRLSRQAQESIKQVAQLAVTAVGIIDGPAHLEMMVKDNEARMIELGARMGGDCITSHLVPLSTGIDMTKQTILYALGQPVDLEPKLNQASAIKFIQAPIGELVSIGGVEEAKSVAHVQEVGFFKHIGDTIQDIRSSGDRLGYVIAQADTVQEALDACQIASEKIITEVK